MFNKKREYHRRSAFLPMVIFRMMLSLTMFLILGLGLYQAYIYFTGTDPLKLNPQELVQSVLSGEGSTKVLPTVLGINLPKSLVSKISQAGGNPEESSTPNQVGPTGSSRPLSNGKVIFRFAVVADSHNNNANLTKALKSAKQEGAKFVIGLGDYTEVGTVDQLQNTKDVFQASGLPYYVTAGDHDLWDARDKGLDPVSRFNEVFGSPYQSFSDSTIRFVILYNADNYDGVDELQQQWLRDTLSDSESEESKQTLVFLHEPLYHPSSDHMMGKTRPELRGQAEEITEILKEANVKGIFAGDIHAFSSYEDPKTGMKMLTAGALTSERNTQKPRFIMVDVFENGDYNVSDTEI